MYEMPKTRVFINGRQNYGRDIDINMATIDLETPLFWALRTIRQGMYVLTNLSLTFSNWKR